MAVATCSSEAECASQQRMPLGQVPARTEDAHETAHHLAARAQGSTANPQEKGRERASC